MSYKDRRRYKEPKLGPTTQKVLLLLFGGLALGLSGNPSQYFRIAKSIKKEWDWINKRTLHRAIKSLYQSKLIDIKDSPGGTTTIILSESGKKRALVYKIDEMIIPKMPRWDGKWRIVAFDIPESNKKARDALARTLKNMGFRKFQKSLFVHPFECKNEVDFVIEYFQLRPFVRLITASNIDNELHLRKDFNLL